MTGPMRAQVAVLGVWLSGCALLRPPADPLVYQLERELLAMKLHNEQLRQRVENCDDAGAQMSIEVHRQLLQVFADSEVRVERRGSQVRVTVPASLVFSQDLLSVRQEAAMVFDLLSVALNLHPQMQIMVIGHTDDRQPPRAVRRNYPDNWALSVAQANAFAQYLSSTFDVALNRLTVAGRGSVDPIADNTTPEGQEQNRRITLYISPEQGEW